MAMTPEEIAKLVKETTAAEVDRRIRQLLSPLLQLVPEEDYLTNSQACALLQCSDTELRRLIKAQELIEGAHFTGSHKSRRWIRDRLERYLETRGDKARQLRDIQKWMKG
jgi:excisionase family DNA binding protein